MKEPYSVRQAAQLLHVSKVTIYRRIEDGTFTTVRDFKGQMHIPAEQIDRVLQEMREAGWE